jgi:hypothetical protein
MKYIHYKTDATWQYVESKNPLELHELQEKVGGLIEFVKLDNHTHIIVNEEGRIKDLEPNPFFTAGAIAGDALQGMIDSKGNFIGFPEGFPQTVRIKICGGCGLKFTGYPAISRVDNKTELCTGCGVKESFCGSSLEDFKRLYNRAFRAPDFSKWGGDKA